MPDPLLLAALFLVAAALYASVGHAGASAYLAACHARLGGPEDARPYVTECLAGNPAFSIRQFMSKEPFRHAEDAAFLGESLLLAGLPD